MLKVISRFFVVFFFGKIGKNCLYKGKNLYNIQLFDFKLMIQAVISCIVRVPFQKTAEQKLTALNAIKLCSKPQKRF